ncbi:DUF962 domain-containing protein [Noviherbaspirillum massiliense]|uniref:Mpo1 family 2-hydroxy fatty acid dioxygenase n=1 Tax=Noviherbaspirillum massiliense TaxID=1465823 RepID=UPI00030CCDFE|nr:Mpo1-like protein [Noviherbaspirillum massiliense]
MRTLADQLSQYAEYHRDRRNILTHFIGIPMIVFGIATLLSRPGFDYMGMQVTPALLVTLASVLYYLVLDLRYGVVMALLMGLAVWGGQAIAAQSTIVWLSAGIGLFVIGWIFQFVGHYYEGRKPAFVDDLVGLIIGPLFVVAEAGFALGMRADLCRQIEERAGPTRSAQLRTQ